jgi:hypothetical protein
MRLIKRNFAGRIRLLMQVHDSLVLQIPTRILHVVLTELYEVLHSIVVPFPDPLTIPWGLKMGTSNWGVCEEFKWEDVTNGQASAGVLCLEKREEAVL